MVIVNSDSTGTLVSLDHALKHAYPSSSTLDDTTVVDEQDLYQTFLYLEADDSWCAHDNSRHAQQQQQQQQPLVPLYVPHNNNNNNNNNNNTGIDEYLSRVPHIKKARNDLFQMAPTLYDRHSPERILYVSQGEIAHAVSSQCDVVVSDKATTCHILAVRSTSTSSAATATPPLVSLTHLDAPSYDDCLRSMIQRHYQHHRRHHNNHHHQKIHVDIHMVGGFEDPQGSSRAISNWLLHLLADIASQYPDDLEMQLQTCLVTSLNDTGHGAPMARGLAINVATGRVCLAQCDEHVCGPCPTLRAARLWSAPPNHTNKQRPLAVVHDEHSHYLTIEPFIYVPFRELDLLLQLKDDCLLQYCSTSPDCEHEDFCHSLRATLRLIRNVPYQKVFGGGSKNNNGHHLVPRLYQRVAGSGNNAWQLM